MQPSSDRATVQSSILIVEDNHRDALLLNRALKALKPDWIMMTVTDAEAAIRWLTRCREHTGDIPLAVVMDLSQPGMASTELLGWIETQPHLNEVKAFVLSDRVEKTVWISLASGRVVSYLPKPTSAFAIAAALAVTE